MEKCQSRDNALTFTRIIVAAETYVCEPLASNGLRRWLHYFGFYAVVYQTVAQQW
jgi:hypothetical protein